MPDGLELVAVRRVDVAVPEVRAEAEAAGQVEHDLRIGAGLAARRDHRAAATAPATCASALTSKPILSASRSKALATGQHDVGQLGRRVHEQVGMDIEVQRRQRLPPPPAVGVGEEQVGAEADQPAHRVGLPAPGSRGRRSSVVTDPHRDGPSGRSRRPRVARALLRRQQIVAAPRSPWARPRRAHCRPGRRSCRSARRAAQIARAIWVEFVCISTPLQA